MEKPVVFIDRRLPVEAMDYLSKHCQIETWGPSELRSREGLLHKLKKAKGLLTSGALINAELIAAAPNLKAVSTMSVGYDHFDLEEMSKSGIIGTHTPYVLDETVADLVFGLMLSAARRITELDQMVKQGQWRGNEGRKLFGLDVHHRKLGIIGMGRIGLSVARRAALGFEMEVSYHNRNRNEKAEECFGAKYLSLEQLLSQSDFIVMLTPLTAETNAMISAQHFNMMKSNAIFINASRGQTVDEEALIEALRAGKIKAAGLDVFVNEPLPADHSLLTLPNVVTLPHIGSATDQTRHDMALCAARNLVYALTGIGSGYIVKELQHNYKGQ